jgi:hypothetical protein
MATVTPISMAAKLADDEDDTDDADDDSELAGPDLVDDGGGDAKNGSADESDDASVQSADVIPLRATEDDQ